MKVCVLGAGRVGSHLAKALYRVGHEVTLWNRGASSFGLCEEKMPFKATADLNDIPNDADVYLISVKDNAVEEVASMLRAHVNSASSLVAHTAGSLPLSILQQHFKNCGVFYPMQTFSRGQSMDYSKIPLFVEEKSNTSGVLMKLAKSMSGTVYELDTNKRAYLHLASVFACNFSNHCFTLSQKILNEIGLPFTTLLPLIEETVEKVKILSPVESQTGPASRKDTLVMEKHMEMLKNDTDMQHIYEIMSKSIIQQGE